MERNKIEMKGILLFLIGVFLLVMLVVAQEEGSGIYFDTSTNQLTTIQTGTTHEATSIEMTKDPNFMETNWETSTNQQKLDYANERFKNKEIEFTKDSNLQNWKITEDGKLIDPKNINIKHDLNDFSKGTKLTPSQNNLHVKISNGASFDIETGTGTFKNPQNFPAPSRTPLSDPGCTSCNSAAKPAGSSRPFGGYPTGQYSGGLPGQYPGGQFGQGLGGIGGGYGAASPLGAVDQAFTQAVGAAQQMVGLVASIAGPLAAAMKTNGQGATSGGSAGTGLGVEGTLENRAAASFENSKRNSKLLLAQNDPNQQTKFNINGNTARISDANAVIPNQLAAKLPSEETTLSLNGIEGNSDFPAESDEDEIPSIQGNPGTIISASLPLLKIPQTKLSATAFVISVDAQELSGQSIELKEHDVEINGHDISVYALKTFNELKAGGNDLKFFSGDIEIDFEAQRILYPRRIKNAPYGIKEVSNKLDSNNNKFTLQHYTNRLGNFYDENQIVSAGDIVTNHPTKKLIIAKQRADMWKN